MTACLARALKKRKQNEVDGTRAVTLLMNGLNMTTLHFPFTCASFHPISPGIYSICLGALPRSPHHHFGLFCGLAGPIVVWYSAKISSYLIKLATNLSDEPKKGPCFAFEVLFFRTNFPPSSIEPTLQLQMITDQQGANNHSSGNVGLYL